MQPSVPYNRPHLTGKELDYISDSHQRGQLAGDGFHTRACEKILEASTGACRVLLTHSCTAAMEMAALLFDINEGEEIIMPSYTFVSTANAFVLRGAKPVFVDIRPDTLNLDETLVEQAITERTRAIVPVHYAGVGCEMDPLLELAKKNELHILEDAAQGVSATYRQRPLGTMGDLGAYSFHETKNIISGEGGALLINDPNLVERAEHIREKGTNRAQFFKGHIDKYTWVDVGSSYVPGEIIAAFLHAQLEKANEITQRRLALWEAYHEALEPLEEQGKLKRPTLPKHCLHNAHLYYIVLNDEVTRNRLIQKFREIGIQSIFHYIPLHSSPAGRKYGQVAGPLVVTEDLSSRVLRLPLWIGMPHPSKIVEALTKIL